jgi:hypothetical protein
MSERTVQDQLDDLEPDEHDPDKGSTWNTINDTEEIEDILSEQELEDFMSEPTEGELGVISDSDVPGRPG